MSGACASGFERGVEGVDPDDGVVEDDTPRISERAVEDVPAIRLAARKRARCLQR